jgi:uncharacterized protein (TIRG00374 family)
MNTNFLKNKFMFLIVSVVLFYVVIILVSDIEKIIANLSKMTLWYYFIIIPLYFSIIFITSWRYQLILKKIGIRLNFKNSILIYTAGLSMLITPGGMGEIIKSHILKQKLDRSLSSTAPIVIYEKWLEFLSIVILIGILLFWVDFIEAKIVFIIGIIFCVAVYLTFTNSKYIGILNKITNKIKFLKKLTVNINEFQKTAIELIRPTFFVKMISITILTKIILIVTIFLIFRSFDVEFDIFQSGQIFLTSLMVGALSFIPGGLLITETGLLGLILKYGVEFSLASLLVLIIRFVSLWFITLIGFCALKIISNKNIVESE